MKVALVARDAAPSRCFRRLGDELTNRRHAAVCFVNEGKPLPVSLDEIRALVCSSEIAVIGMSSSKELAEPELIACAAAVEAGIPFGFYLDTANCHMRDWFAGFLNRARFFFAINDREAKRVFTAYPNAYAVATGNPLREDAFSPKFTRDEVRQKLGVAEEETLVLAPGGKSPVVNILVWGILLETLAKVPNRMFRVILTCHPGDRTPFAVDQDMILNNSKELLKLLKLGEGLDREGILKVIEGGITKAQLNLYGDLIRFAPPGLKVEFVGNDVMSTDDMVPGADLIAEFGSTIGINAAAQRKPVISISTAIGKQCLFSTSKTRTTESVELGLAAWCSADDVDNMAICIANILVPSGFAKYRAKQEEECPKPVAQGAAVKAMANELERLLQLAKHNV